ncbi:30S ribosomal protein S2 [Candidatus Pacearchaeota archaeon]|nr:30S ribosomal protein S2 [Candidatus Pacearchaeota archaeon]
MVEKVSEKTSLKSLAEQLKERISKDEIELKEKKSKEKVKDISDEDIEEISKKISKKEVEEEKKSISSKDETLLPLEDYIKCAVHLGTKVITPSMRKYVYKRRADGLAVINTIKIDQKLRETIDFLKNYKPETIYLVCKREAGWNAAKKFEEATGIKVFTKKYSPGITTNLSLSNFFESELTMICDPWIDKNALNDTIKLKKPIIALCDTNNYTFGITKIIPCNNKSGKSIGCILFILAREYCKQIGKPFKYSLEHFTGPLEA